MPELELTTNPPLGGLPIGVCAPEDEYVPWKAGLAVPEEGREFG